MKTILTIMKNFFPVIIGDLKNLLKRSRKARWIFAVIIISALGFGGYKIWKNYRPDPNSQDLSLSQAGRIGEVTTHKLMVQIENRNCPPEMQNGCYERGDIVLIKDGKWEFSDAEKAGFLILHMDLTEKQSEILVQSLEQKSKIQPPKDEKQPGGEKNAPPAMETLKMRKYAVELSKIGINPDDQKGREVGDKAYKWDVVKEKKN
jgi:hypothetical protein